MTQFAFLDIEFKALATLAKKAETFALSDPRNACFHARLALETAVKWMYERDSSLKKPYDTTLAALIHEPTFRELTGNAIVAKARLIKDYGNSAAHDTRVLKPDSAINAVRELFHVCFWLTRTYARDAKPPPDLTFDPAKLEKSLTISASTIAKIKEQSDALQAEQKAAEQTRAELMASDAERAKLEAELEKLRAEFAAVKQANTAAPDTHDYGEAQTRDAFIDKYLHEAGWPLDQERDREFPVTGMPNESGNGFVDYVLWGDDGKPLAVVEAKRTKKDARVGQQQAKLYADCLQAQYGRRPLIFYTNGYEHWFWDDELYPPREVHGFLKKAEMELAMQRRDSRKPLRSVAIDENIAGRFYQTRAIRRIGETFERDHQRNALLVMATGSGKTRTVIALVDQLMRANWVKRVLFLADRRALVKQAHNAFKTHLPASPSANLLQQHDPKSNDHNGARVLLSTYPTMMNLIDEMDGDSRRFGPGHFDLIIIDEAHRSVYRRYRAIFEYYDSLLVGLTATPREEIDRDTYSLFGLETGVPTDSYDLDNAVADGFLAPPEVKSVPLKFQREGINYDDLSEEEKESWDEIEWDEDGNAPDRVEAAAVNKWLFNKDTVDKVLEHLMTHGLKVEQGDRLGKTIIFAKNDDHAQFIGERFDANYPHLAGKFARVISYKGDYAGTLIDDFSEANKDPHIAISIDMLDTGIDVSEILNLVFFKIVRSKTKFWQMIGRGTRLCPDLLGPGAYKDHFQIFDFCQNFEFFNQNLTISDSAAAGSLRETLFTTRIDVMAELDGAIAGMEDAATPFAGADSDTATQNPLSDLRASIADRLFDEVAGMNVDNFLVRPKRRSVEVFQQRKAWDRLSMNDRIDLCENVAGLPTAFEDDELPAKQFDLVILRAQLCLLRQDSGFVRLQERIRGIASKLEELGNVPMITAEMALILEVQTDEYWQDITPSILDSARRKLRSLVQLIEPTARNIVYTDFTDEIGESTNVETPFSSVGTDKTRFLMKVRHFLTQHEDHISILRVKRNEQLTPQDLSELERIFVNEGVCDSEEIDTLHDDGLGIFIRSLVGLDRSAAKESLSSFSKGKALNSNQIEFVDLLVDCLTEQGVVDPSRLYESPFTDIDDQGVSGVFSNEEVRDLVEILNQIRANAAA